MVDSAVLKVDRALKGVGELGRLVRERRPFTYVVETNTRTCERATFAKKNRPVVDEAAILCGEIVHNLRSALDHAYWEIVSQFATSKREEKNIQFPFCESATRVEEILKRRLADHVSTRFFEALVDLRPHGDPGGNELLYLVDELDILDKHRLLIPTGDYTRLSSKDLTSQIPDFPQNLKLIDSHFGSNHRDIGWRTPRYILSQIDLGAPRPPTLHEFEKELDVPVGIVFTTGKDQLSRPVIPTLNAMADVTRETIKIVRAAAS